MGTLGSLIFQINIYEHLLWTRHRLYSVNKLVNKKNSLNSPKTYSQCKSYVSSTFLSLSVSQQGCCSQTAPPCSHATRLQSGSWHKEVPVEGRRERIGEREAKVFLDLLLYFWPHFSWWLHLFSSFYFFQMTILHMVPHEIVDSWDHPIHVFSSLQVIMDSWLS